jgi:hypothetical protein
MSSAFLEMSYRRLRHLLAHRLAAPYVLGAPPPALPAVGVADLQGVATEQLQQLAHAAVRTVHALVLAVLVGLVEDGSRPVGLLDAYELVGDDVQRLVPGDALVLALAAVLGVAAAQAGGPRRAARVEVHALHGVAHPARREHALLVGQAQRRRQALVAGLEGLAAGVHHPGLDLLPGVLVVVTGGTDADDLAVLHIHHAGVGAVVYAAPTDVPDQCLLTYCVRRSGDQRLHAFPLYS